MALLSQARQVTRVVKNAGRMREIVGAMSRFGFGTFVDRIGLRNYGPDSKIDAHDAQPIPVRLRLLFEQLGPTFIKVGQILAGRPDLVPPEFVRELGKLQDQVAVIPFNTLKPILERDLGRTLDACFSSFDPEPLAAASIAQVHAARTLDGEEIVVKIKKPDVDRLLAQDLEILDLLATLLERYVSELRPWRPRLLVLEFKRSLMAETNFVLEAYNVKRFRENFADNEFLVVPKVYSELSNASVISLERLRGVKLSDVAGVQAMGIDPKKVMSGGMDCFFESIMVYGFFHADPHAGNILVMPDGRLGLIDFGSVGRLSQKSKDALVSMFLALFTQDYDLLVMEYLSMSPDSESSSRSSGAVAALQKDVADVFTPYHGLPLKDIPMGKLLMEASGMAFKHRVAIPRDLILVFKAIMTLEGIGRSLDPDFDLVSAASKYTKIVLKDRYSPKRVAKDLIFMWREITRFTEKAPRQFSELLRQLENGEFRGHLQVTNLDTLARAQLQGQSRVALAILSAGLIVGAVLASDDAKLPLWGQLTLWVCAIGTGARAFWKSFR